MSYRQTCVGCGCASPPTNSNYTLISKGHGWRLSRTFTVDGMFVAEWRCPACWQEHKNATRSARATDSNRASVFFARARKLLGRQSVAPPSSE